MDKIIQKMNCKTAKKMPLEQIMACLNIPIEKTLGNDIWYLSPFKSEKTASFKINTNRNIWFDFSLGQGGDGIKLIQTLKNCDAKKALEFLSEIMGGDFVYQKSETFKSELNKSSIKILNISLVSDKKLTQYLNSRGIFSDQAISFCKVIEYENMGRKFKSVAFENLSGGFEIRSEGFKSCHGKKDISLLKNGGQNILIFEGFFDFLSYLETPNLKVENADYLILNSLVNSRKISNILEIYRKIFLFLDNDEAGNKAKLELKKVGKEIIDMSVFYEKYKDLNECLVSERKDLNKLGVNTFIGCSPLEPCRLHQAEFVGSCRRPSHSL
jgi:Toprim-like/CHC2 zinc finger